MTRARPKGRKGRICPTCGVPVYVRVERSDFGTCPQCGEWLVERGLWNRKLERLDQEPGETFDETSDWERSLVDQIE